MRLAVRLLVVAGLAAGAYSYAAEPAPHAGQWIVTSNYESVATMPLAAPKIENACLADADFTNGRFPLHAMPSCKLVDAVRQGGEYKLNFKCSAIEVADVVGNLSIDSPEKLTGRIVVHFHQTTDGKTPEFVYNVDAKRTGDCSGVAAK